MYCSKCGKEIHDDAVICIHCGRSVQSEARALEIMNDYPWTSSAMSVLIIFTVIFPIIGYVAGVYGLLKDSKREQGIKLLVVALICSFIWRWLMS